jgi:hypothetical protein
MKGKKTGGRDFVPGVSGNPAGRPPLPEEIKDARSQSKEKIERALHEIAFKKMDEIKAILDSPHSPAMDMIVAKIIQRAVETGDTLRAGFILDRMIGKVAENINLGGTVHAGLVAAISARKNNAQ